MIYKLLDMFTNDNGKRQPRNENKLYLSSEEKKILKTLSGKDKREYLKKIKSEKG